MPHLPDLDARRRALGVAMIAGLALVAFAGDAGVARGPPDSAAALRSR